MKKYTIKKGKHYSLNFPKLFWNKEKMKITFKFDSSAIYNIPGDDMKDWNKLFGFSRGLHHKNSVRLAWRWNNEISKIEITEYYYTNGVRKYNDTPLLSINPNETHNLEIEIENKNSCKLGYALFPFFGGNVPAPHDVTIQVSYSF
jgi:hypothetical protein